MESVRLDKWLWFTRFFKTRSFATDACKRNQIKVNEVKAKPSREVKKGDVIELRKGPLFLTIQITDLLKQRVSAVKSKEFFKDLTPPEKYLEAEAESKRFRMLSKGKPTKKQRRQLEEFLFHNEL
ncbi:MAG: RNA-binding S4 domain-containing protein [Opitutales bacterium]|nr:RNA-binding S4 domain-containing protein [Opitutales bacterium]